MPTDWSSCEKLKRVRLQENLRLRVFYLRGLENLDFLSDCRKVLVEKKKSAIKYKAGPNSLAWLANPPPLRGLENRPCRAYRRQPETFCLRGGHDSECLLRVQEWTEVELCRMEVILAVIIHLAFSDVVTASPCCVFSKLLASGHILSQLIYQTSEMMIMVKPK